MLDFHTFWVVTKQNRTVQGTLWNFGPGALNDTKKIRKAGGKMFANVRPEKQDKSKKIQEQAGTSKNRNPNQSKIQTKKYTRFARGVAGRD